MRKQDLVDEVGRIAAEGPRVAAIVAHDAKVFAVAGYIDADTDTLRQIALVTPDGRIWLPASRDDLRDRLVLMQQEMQDDRRRAR